MKRRFAIRGGSKWALLLASIVVLEALPGPTLSSSHIQATLNRNTRAPVLLLEVYLLAHLWKLIPDRYDPLRNLDKIKVARNDMTWYDSLRDGRD